MGLLQSKIYFFHQLQITKIKFVSTLNRKSVFYIIVHVETIGLHKGEVKLA